MSKAPAIRVERMSKWYGQVLGVSEVSLEVRGGIVGLLGPNGAGKSTLLKTLAGLLRPSRGLVEVLGGAPFASVEVRRRLGYCPEHEGTYEELSGREFVAALAELSGMGRSEASRRAENALAEMGLFEAQDRPLRSYSKGMRQRAKLAQAFVHDPNLLLLDEPLTGCDPVARAGIIAAIQRLAAAGKTVLVSSHVLYEIEALTREIVLMHRGQILAEGNVYRIRELIDDHPHRVRVECDRPRDLAARLLAEDHVVRVQFEEGALEVETRTPDRMYDALSEAALALGVKIRSLTSPDNNLQAVFEYLTAKSGGSQ
jgi:ABC-2 type transport system ATP-binding protein